jgi:2-octaprenyl-6-methoxyphenol hydroxylase
MAKTNSSFDFAISGASFAGLALARGLSQAFGSGVTIALIDRTAGLAGPAADTRAFAIWAASKNLLEVLGVWPEIAPEAEPITTIEITDSDLGDAMRPARLTFEALTADGAVAGTIVPASLMHQALYNSVAADPAITWIAPAEATDLDLGEPLASIGLSDGRRVHARLIIAAEGRNSKLRAAAGIKTTGSDYGQTGIVTIVQFSEPHGGVAIQHFLPGGPFAILPMTDNRACITWSSANDEAQRIRGLDDAAFLAELDQRIGGRFGTIALAGPRQSWPLEMKIARELTANRFVLAGDAAHGVHPVAGQGVNLAFHDCAALIEVLVDAVRLGLDPGSADILDRYARWRRFSSSTSAAAYDGLNRLFGLDNTVLRAGRGAALDVVDRLPFLKQYILTEAAGLSGDVPKMLKGEWV